MSACDCCAPFPFLMKGFRTEERLAQSSWGCCVPWGDPVPALCATAMGKAALWPWCVQHPFSIDVDTVYSTASSNFSAWNLMSLGSLFPNVQQTTSRNQGGTLFFAEKRWKFGHSPTPSCYLKVWLNQWQAGDLFSPPFTSTALPPYEWHGTGTPCFAGVSVYAPESLIVESDWRTLPAYQSGDPDIASGSGVEILKWSFLEGYVPSDPPLHNGYIPLPRPCSDPLTDGYPTFPIILGCTEPCDSNYNSEATCDDGSCNGDIANCLEDWE